MRFYGLEITIEKQLRRVVRGGILLLGALLLAGFFCGWWLGLKDGVQQVFAQHNFFWRQGQHFNFLSAWFLDGIVFGVLSPTIIILAALLISYFRRARIKGAGYGFIESYLRQAGLRLNLSNLEQVIFHVLLVGLILLLPQVLIAPYFDLPRELVYSLLWSFMGYCFLIEVYYLGFNWYSRNRVVRTVDQHLGLKEALLTCIQGSKQGKAELQDYLNHQVVRRIKEQSIDRVFPYRLPGVSRNNLLRQLFLINLTALFLSVVLPPFLSNYIFDPPVVASQELPEPEFFNLAQQIWQEGEEIEQVVAQLENLADTQEDELASAAVELKQLGEELAILSFRGRHSFTLGRSVAGDKFKLALSGKKAQLREKLLNKQADERGSKKSFSTHKRDLEEEALTLTERAKIPVTISYLGNTQFQMGAWPQLNAALLNDWKNGTGSGRSLAITGKDYVKMAMSAGAPSLANAASLEDENYQLQKYLNNKTVGQQGKLNQAAASQQSKEMVPKEHATTSSPGKQAEIPSAPDVSPIKQEVPAAVQGEDLQKILEELNKWQEELAQSLATIKDEEDAREDVFEGRDGQSSRQATLIRGHKDDQEQLDKGDKKIRLSGVQDDPHHDDVVNVDPNNEKTPQPLTPDSERSAIVAQVNLDGSSPNQPESQVDEGKGHAGEGEAMQGLGLNPEDRELSASQQLSLKSVPSTDKYYLDRNISEVPKDEDNFQYKYKMQEKLLKANSLSAKGRQEAEKQLATRQLNPANRQTTPATSSGDAVVEKMSGNDRKAVGVNSDKDRGNFDSSAFDDSMLRSIEKRKVGEMASSSSLSGAKFIKQAETMRKNLGKKKNQDKGVKLAMVKLNNGQKEKAFRRDESKVEKLLLTSASEDNTISSRLNKQEIENKARETQKQKMLAKQKKNIKAALLMDVGKAQKRLSAQISTLRLDLNKVKSLLKDGSKGSNPHWEAILDKAFTRMDEYQKYREKQAASESKNADGGNKHLGLSPQVASEEGILSQVTENGQILGGKKTELQKGELEKTEAQQSTQKRSSANRGQPGLRLAESDQKVDSSANRFQGVDQAQSPEIQEKELQKLSRQLESLNGLSPQTENLSVRMKDLTLQVESQTFEPPESLPLQNSGKARNKGKGMNKGDGNNGDGNNGKRYDTQKAKYLGDSSPRQDQLRMQTLSKANQFLDKMLFLLEGKNSASLVRDTSAGNDLSSQSSRQDRGGMPMSPNPSVSNEYLFPGEGATKEAQSVQPIYLDEQLADASNFDPSRSANPGAGFNEEMSRLNEYRTQPGQSASRSLSSQKLQEKMNDVQSGNSKRMSGLSGNDSWEKHSASLRLPRYQKHLLPQDEIRRAYPGQENLSREDVFAKVVKRLRKVRERLARAKTSYSRTVRPLVSKTVRQGDRKPQRPAKQPAQAALASDRWKLTSHELENAPQRRERTKKKSTMPDDTLVSFASQKKLVLWAEVPVSEGSGSGPASSAKVPEIAEAEAQLSLVAQAADPVGYQPLPYFYQSIIRQLFNRRPHKP